MTIRSVLHINSYFATRALHAKLVAALTDAANMHQYVYVPVHDKLLIGRHGEHLTHNTTLIYSKCFNRLDRLLWPLKMAKLHRDCFTTISPLRFDVIHAHSLTVNGLLAYHCHKRTGIPYVVTVRNTDVLTFLRNSKIFRALLKPVLAEAQAITFLSPAYWRHHFVSFYQPTFLKALEPKVHVIPNGVDPLWFNATYLHPKPTRNMVNILFSGRVVKNKNLIGLLQACRVVHLKGIRCRVLIVGDGPDKKHLLQKQWPFEIIDYGYIHSANALPAIYRKSDILAVPSFRESFGLVYAEALSQGVPVIYSQHQGFDGLYEDGEIGFAVNPHDVGDIAEKIETTIDNLSVMRARAFDAGKRFSWNNAARDYLQAYQS